MNDTSSSDTQPSGRGALAEFKEAVGGLINQVSGLTSVRGSFAESNPFTSRGPLHMWIAGSVQASRPLTLVANSHKIV